MPENPWSFKNGKSFVTVVFENKEPIPVFSDLTAGADALCRITSTCLPCKFRPLLIELV